MIIGHDTGDCTEGQVVSSTTSQTQIKVSKSYKEHS